MNAIGTACNKFSSEKEQRQWRYYLLEFESFHLLSVKVLHGAAGEDENLPRELILVKYSHEEMNGKTNAKHYLHFFVARVEDGAQL
jgi:hypothetical protein